ncbi:MAG TPA: hypothetical protein VNI57_09150 [Candidatus Saccharimonadales bacterium]|nr:hypothetical protein [Candidatus Saccharimonadales bacterium]
MRTALIPGTCAFGVSLLTLCSDFGLGTLLMPAFELFFPVPVEVASTAVVHAASRLFQASIVFGEARRDVIVRFGFPAVASALAGHLLAPGVA